MSQETFELVAGHVIIRKDGQRFLLDTGSPTSFGSPGSLRLFGNTVTLAPNAAPFDAAAIGREVGLLAAPPIDLPLDGLIGTNLFRGLALTIDWGARTITTRSARSEPTGWKGDLAGGLPSAQLSVAGQTVTAIADTGARICFADPRLLEGTPVAGRTRDFFLGLGGFETTLRTVEVQLDGRTETIPFAEAPPMVVAAMTLAGARAIIGTDLMMRCGPTRFVFPERAGR
jgi:hypothetical protein